MDANELLTTTRSVRRRLDETRQVPRRLLLDCIEIAAQAPIGGNRQRMRWILVEDPAKRLDVVEAFRAPALEQFEQLRSAARDDIGRRTYQGAIDLLLRMERIPVLVIPCMLGTRPDPMPHALAASYYGSAVPAIWSFQLALRSRGLGTVFTTVHLQHEREVAEVLGIPDGVTQMALLPVAYTTGDGFRPAARKSAEEIVAFDSWD